MTGWIKCGDLLPAERKIVYIAYRPEDPATATAYRYNGQWVAAAIFYNLTHSPGPFEFRQKIITDEVMSWHELPDLDSQEIEE
jgi:hypothetical protein